MEIERKVLFKLVNNAKRLFTIDCSVSEPIHSTDNNTDSYVFYWEGFEFEKRVIGACCLIPLSNGKECEIVCKKYFNESEPLVITKTIKID